MARGLALLTGFVVSKPWRREWQTTEHPSWDTDAVTTIMVWNCGDDDLEYANREVAHLESLRSGQCDVVTAGRSIGWDRLASFARSVRPTIFHFIGHGDSIGQLVVRDENGLFGRPAADVIRLVRAASPSLEGVYLSACFTAKTGPELLDSLPTAGGWAIGTASEVDDDLAAGFSEKFYQHLVRDAASPEEAYRVANAYALSDWPDEVPHSAWFALSRLPAVDQMAQTIGSGIRGIFDRSAFKIQMRHEVSMQELDDALQDVSHALGTGQVRSRQHQTVIAPASFPPEWLQDPEIQDFVVRATRGIAATRRALAIVKGGAQGTGYVAGNVLNFDPSATHDEWMNRVNKVDQARNQILKAANALFVRNNLEPFPEITLSFSRADIQQARARAGA